MADAKPSDTPRAPPWARRLLPWLVALACLFWLLGSIPAGELWAAFRRVPAGTFLVMAVAYVLGILLTDSLATWVTFARALPTLRLSYRETVLMRGASYLLGVLNWGAGQAGVAYFLYQRHHVRGPQAAGAVLFTMGINAVLLAGSVALALALGAAPDEPTLRLIVYALGGGFFVHLLLVATQPKFLRRFAIFSPFLAAGVRGHLIVGALRLPHLAALIVGHLLIMRLFGVAVPTSAALALLPVVFMVAIVPISPGGLGTAQAAAVTLFAPFVAASTVSEQRATVLAYSLGLHFVTLAVQALLGVECLRRLGRPGATFPEPRGR